MIYKEIQADLFTMPKEYYLVHYISADFAMEAGIAKEIVSRYNTKNNLLAKYPATRIPYWDKLKEKYKGLCEKDNRILNLIIKRNYWNKPTLLTIKNSLIWLKDICIDNHINKLAMPMTGCGLDHLSWSDVSSLLKEIFNDTDIEIVVCKL